MLRLVKLTPEYRPQLNEMMDEWTQAGEKIVPYAIRKVDHHDFDRYLSSLEVSKADNGLVPDSTFFCLDTERNLFVGAVNIRHYLNKGLLLSGGHVGDGIRPSERRKGFGTKMVALALEECRKLGISRALMVCDKNNIASAKTIMKNGGVLENEIEADGITEQRYWIDLTGRGNALGVISDRCSYRGAYLPSPVPQEDLIRILEAGLAAPSGCNKQTTSLIAVDNPEILAKLNALIDPPVGKTDTAPAMVCVLTRRIVAYRDRCFAVQDYSAAIQNMLLAITALGYASSWIEGHITDVDQIGRKMADVLGVPEEYELVCYLPVGIPAEPVVRGAKKQPFAQRAWLNGFGKSE